MRLRKQPVKYLSKVDGNTYKKLHKQLNHLEQGTARVEKLKDSEYYKLSIEQYRIIMLYDTANNIIDVVEINSRTNISYRRYM